MSSLRFVLDTNIVIRLTDGEDVNIIPNNDRFVSVVTEMELFASPSLTPEKEQIRRDFLRETTIVPLTEPVKQEAIRIRRFGSPRLKLPDAIIAATACVLDATLVTNDDTMLKLNWQGLTITAA